jgi:hypothetical protein
MIAAIVVGALACPVMMWLGRRGIGPGCAMMDACAPEDQEGETLEELRRREREVSARVARLEREAPLEPTQRD